MRSSLVVICIGFSFHSTGEVVKHISSQGLKAALVGNPYGSGCFLEQQSLESVEREEVSLTAIDMLLGVV